MITLLKGQRGARMINSDNNFILVSPGVPSGPVPPPGGAPGPGVNSYRENLKSLEDGPLPLFFITLDPLSRVAGMPAPSGSLGHRLLGIG